MEIKQNNFFFIFLIGNNLPYLPVNETDVIAFWNSTSFLVWPLSKFTEILSRTSKVYEKHLRRRIKHAENNSHFQVDMAIFYIILTCRTF